MNFKKTLLFGALSITFAILFPSLLFALVALNLVLLLGVMGLQLFVTRRPVDAPARTNISDEPFVSIHVPAHNEPPELVEQTCLVSPGSTGRTTKCSSSQ